MILASMILLWFSLALLWTFALGWAASDPLPKPDFLGCASDFAPRLEVNRGSSS